MVLRSATDAGNSRRCPGVSINWLGLRPDGWIVASAGEAGGRRFQWFRLSSLSVVLPAGCILR